MNKNSQSKITKIGSIIRKSPVEVAVIGVMSFVLALLVIPAQVGATATDTTAEDKAIALEVEAMQNETEKSGVLPAADVKTTADRIMYVSATAYNSDPNQTDSTPDITASGTKTRDGIIAANFLPIGTLVRLPDLYGDKVFVVEDRMNARYTSRIDVWMENHADAIKFGLKNKVKLEVIYAK